MSAPFSTSTYGKWILAGEHSVLRGSPALVFPLFSRRLDLRYSSLPLDSSKSKLTGEALSSPFELKLHGDHGAELEILFRGVLEKALEMKNLSMDQLQGRWEISNSIPIGAGLGASASLCVAVTRWLESLGVVTLNERQEFARQLENLFHGESSGVDVAVVTEEKGLYFLKSGPRENFVPAWKPSLFISFSGQKGVTFECVRQVKALIEKNPEEGVHWDEKMKSAVDLARRSLALDEPRGFSLLKDSLESAADCFRAWGLSDGALGEHLQFLKDNGAAAVKPTGSGGGGYALSLWKTEPPASLNSILIPCFSPLTTHTKSN